MRKPYGPGWALVGDAGCHKDPMLALGICHALHDAELLADLASEGLSGQHDMDAPSPDLLALRQALRDRPEDSRLFAMAGFGMIPRERFFNPDGLQRILGARAA